MLEMVTKGFFAIHFDKNKNMKTIAKVQNMLTYGDYGEDSRSDKNQDWGCVYI